MSCATRQAARMTAFPESAMDSAFGMVSQNSPEIKKYFLLDENRDIVVKAEFSVNKTQKQYGAAGIEHFDVTYDLKHAEAEESGGFLISFSVKSLETREVRQGKLFWRPEKDEAGLLLAFDDNYTETWEQNFDLLDHYNARVTFFIQGEFCSFCLVALERGHDVGYHTQNHLNLPKVSREVFDEETLSGVESFRNAGVPLTSFAYPFGLSEEWMHEELLKSFKILRGYGVTFRLYDRASVREGYSSSKALDNILFRRDEDFEEIVNLMFRTVKFIGGNLILPLTTHDISDTADWGIKPGRLKYLLQTANDLQINFFRYKDL